MRPKNFLRKKIQRKVSREGHQESKHGRPGRDEVHDMHSLRMQMTEKHHSLRKNLRACGMVRTCQHGVLSRTGQHEGRALGHLELRTGPARSDLI